MNSTPYKKAANLIDIFDGVTQTVFFDSSESKYVTYERGASVDEFIIGELKKLLGDENVVYK